MTISVKHSDTNTLIKIEGHFDAALLDQAHTIFEELAAQIDRTILIDLSQTTRLDTSGVGAIVFLFKRVRMWGYSLEIIGAHGQPLRKLRSLKITKTIKISSLQ